MTTKETISSSASPKTWASPITDYSNKIILAPMVRVGILPLRILAKQYGADIVYSDEIIDKKLIHCKRVVNEKLGTIEYLDKNGGKVFARCMNKTDSPTVLQIGTADAETALKAAQHLYQDYDAIDVNMGCPKTFSVQGGMGAALLKDKERIKSILTTLVNNIPDKPVTCKIRLLEDMQETIDLVKMIEQTGVKAIAVHARYIPQRPREPAHLHLLKQVVEAVKIPVIANGDVFEQSTMEDIKQKTGCSSLMVARGALWNLSIFRKEGPLPPCQVGLDIIQKCIQYQHTFPGTKYVLMKMFEDKPKEAPFTALTRAKNFADLEAALKSCLPATNAPNSTAAVAANGTAPVVTQATPVITTTTATAATSETATTTTPTTNNKKRDIQEVTDSSSPTTTSEQGQQPIAEEAEETGEPNAKKQRIN